MGRVLPFKYICRRSVNAKLSVSRLADLHIFTSTGKVRHITDLQCLSCRTGASIPKQYGVIVFISFALSVWQQPPDLVGAVLAKGVIEKKRDNKGPAGKAKGKVLD